EGEGLCFLRVPEAVSRSCRHRPATSSASRRSRMPSFAASPTGSALSWHRRTRIWAAPGRCVRLFPAPANARHFGSLRSGSPAGAAPIVQLMDGYTRPPLRAQAVEGDHPSYKAIVVVFTDLSADRAKQYMDDRQIQDLKRLSYAEDGI